MAPVDSEEVLVLAPHGRDAELICEAIAQRGYACRAVRTPDELLEAIRGEAGAAVVSQEALLEGGLKRLLEHAEAQPAWSDFPLVVLTARDAEPRQAQQLLELGNVTLLERPISTETLVAAVRSALRGRRRQYAARRAIVQREQFLAMLGHELRNPLGAVIFACDLLRRGASAAETERYLSIISRQARHLARLVDDLLEVSRVTSGKLNLQLRRVELRDAVQKALQTVDEPLRARRHRLSLEQPPQPLWLNADPVRLEQILTNLLTNAIKYTPPGGLIAVTVAVEEKTAVVRVRDTGVGIDPALLPQLFEPFAQANTSLDRSEGGMGLGLAVVRALVERQGGFVAARSEGAGRGSEFEVRLPLMQEVRRGDAPAPAPLAAGDEHLRLVLVEDSPDLCEVLADLLRTEGHEVEIANDGPRGLELIERVRPDLAFIDIGLPGLDGYQVAQRVRTDLGDEVRLVALTGYGQPEDAARARDAGFDRHLKKPIDVAALSKLLHEVTPSRKGPPSASLLR